MAILTMPTIPAFSASSFGLASNTQAFENPLTGQTQTLERPGARWQAQYTLPPMKRAQAVAWQNFLLQLRGGAGRFYGYDPDAKTPRGSALASSLSGRNELRNGNAGGAVTGIVGSGGSPPTTWAFSTANGLTRTVLASGVEGGISFVEVRFAGTPTTNAALTFDNGTQIACAEGETWTTSCYYRMTAGSMSNITTLQQFVSQVRADGMININTYGNLGTVDNTWRRASYTRTISDTTPDTMRIKSGFYLSLALGQPIDITLRLGNCQLERAASPSDYVPTTTTARVRGAGVRVDGNAMPGTSVATWNWEPGIANVMRAGDYVSFDMANGRSLHMLTANASSDAAGRATLRIEPPLRNPPPDNTAVIISNASCVMALDEASINWQVDAQGVYRLSFGAIERF